MIHAILTDTRKHIDMITWTNKKGDAMKIETSKNKGHFEVEFSDGLAGIGIYDKNLDSTIRILGRVDRPIKSIEWIEDRKE